LFIKNEHLGRVNRGTLTGVTNRGHLILVLTGALLIQGNRGWAGGRGRDHGGIFFNPQTETEMKVFAEVFIKEIGNLAEAFPLDDETPEEVRRLFSLSIQVLRHWHAYQQVKHRGYRYPHTVADRWDGQETL
jgi:hypothetical protein